MEKGIKEIKNIRARRQRHNTNTRNTNSGIAETTEINHICLRMRNFQNR